MRLPGIDTFGDLCDRLAVVVYTLAVMENRKRDEQAKPDKNLDLIARLDNTSRDACELRSQIKNKINECLAEIVASGEYKVLKEARTFRPPATRLSDVLADACKEYADTFSKLLAEELLA